MKKWKLSYLAGALLVAGTAVPGLAAPGARNSIVRVVTVNQTGLSRSTPARLAGTLDRLNWAASFHPDIACLPERFLLDVTETVPGPVTRRLAAWARRHSSYVIFGLRTRSRGRLYNTAVLLDRQGRVVGQYHKIHPTEGELRLGIHPGNPDPPVFDTDFGKIGIQICFDVNWWDTWKRLKQKGAKIIFFPAAYPAATQLATIALTNQVYIVSSSRTCRSRIYDITGRTLGITGVHQQWTGAVLPLGKRLFETDFHTAKVRRIQQEYGDRVEVVWYHEDDWFTLASLDPQVPTEELIRKFGLTPLDAYRRRAERAIEKARRAAPAVK